MIKSFRHKGLRRFFEASITAGIHAAHARKIHLELTALETAATIEDMAVPGFHLHPSKGSGRASGQLP